MTKHYMRLLVDVELNEKQKNVWYRIVEKFLGAKYNPHPDEASTSLTSYRDEFEGDDEFPYVYVIYLNDDVDPEMAEQIVKLWAKIYPRDFLIETSADIDSAIGCGNDSDEPCKIEIDDDMYEEIQRRASKFFHNRWVEDQIKEGWRYGFAKNSKEKTDPRLRDWDNLHKDYKQELLLDRDQAIKFFKTYPHLFV